MTDTAINEQEIISSDEQEEGESGQIQTNGMGSHQDAEKPQGDVVLKVENLSKKFCRNLKRSMLYGIQDLAKGMVGVEPDTTRLRKDEFWALKDINFELKEGEILGIIGANGAGKSTLLRVLTGIFPPDCGRIWMDGNIGGIIALGAGMHPHMTGRENIYLNGTILGMSKEEIDEKFDDIVEFAEIGDFLDAPFNTYSSGMRVRLGFAVAIQCQPDILLVDEVLAVGDMNFRQKSMRRMSKILDTQNSIIYISHNLPQIQTLCTRCVVLNEGKIVFNGDVDHAVAKFYAMQEVNEEADDIDVTGDIIKTVDIDFFDERKNTINETTNGKDLLVRLKFNMSDNIENVYAVFGMSMDAATRNIYPSYYDNQSFDLKDGDELWLRIRKPYLTPGTYRTSVGIWDQSKTYCYYWDFQKTPKIIVKEKNKLISRFMFDHSWTKFNPDD